ncbi:MAG: succinate--CoA ligase subunit alpha, partial [Longimicrobiales bacterium]
QLHSRLMMQYGTRIVGGVSPGARSRAVNGIPVFANCAEAVQETGAQASVLLVGAMQLLGAMREAIASGIRYLVTPTEGMPAHDALKAWRLARDAGVVWVGASTPGMAVPGEAKLGFLPDDSLTPGPLGLMSKSGTLSYEAGYRLAQTGIGTSVWVGIGGDPVKGTRFSDLVPFYAADTKTTALLIIGEIGGTDEEEFARALREQRFAKPVFALIAGASAPDGVTMGHAGALVHGAHGTYAAKRAALEAAGVTVLGSLGEMVREICGRLIPPARPST